MAWVTLKDAVDNAGLKWLPKARFKACANVKFNKFMRHSGVKELCGREPMTIAEIYAGFPGITRPEWTLTPTGADWGDMFKYDGRVEWVTLVTLTAEDLTDAAKVQLFVKTVTQFGPWARQAVFMENLKKLSPSLRKTAAVRNLWARVSSTRKNDPKLAGLDDLIEALAAGGLRAA